MRTLTSANPSRGIRVLLACFVGALGCARAVAGAGDADLLMVASTPEHVWFMVKDPAHPSSWRLMHHAEGMGGPYARVARTLDTKPVTIAAEGDRVILALPRKLPSESDLDLLGLRVQRNDAMGSYFDLPLDGWEVLAGVPSDAPLGGLAVGPDGPLALLLPEKRVAQGVRRTGGSSETELHRARLMRQNGFAWTLIELPEVLSANGSQRLCPVSGVAEAVILAKDPQGSGRIHSLLEGTWTEHGLDVPEESIERMARFQDRLAFAIARTEGSISIAVERGGSLLDVASLPTPGETWGLAASGDKLLLIEVDAVGTIMVRAVDLIQGTLGAPIEWTRPPLDISDWLHLPIIGMLVVAALLAIVLFRRSESPDAPLRAGVVPMPLGRRLTALLIDLVPGFILALVVFDADLSRISAMPLWSSELAFAGPGALIIGVTILHETVAELIWQRSLGKALMGGIVRSSEGSQPPSGRILLRGLFKAVVLYAPILAVFVLLSPALQGVPETVSRTVVADARVPENEPNPE